MTSEEIPAAMIYSGEKLKPYEEAVNCAAEELAIQNPCRSCAAIVHCLKDIYYFGYQSETATLY